MSNFAHILGKYRSSDLSLTNGDTSEARIDVTGKLMVSSGTGAADLGKAEDAVAASGDTGIAVLSVRRDTAATSAGTDGDYATVNTDANGNTWASLGTKIAGEDLTNDVMKVEGRFSYGRVTADGQIKASAGFIHTVTFSATGAVTAGVITIYDNTAESGTVIWSGIIQVATAPVTITLDVVAATGIYVGYDGTIANVATTVSYR